jgi:hypothetical protein
MRHRLPGLLALFLLLTACPAVAHDNNAWAPTPVPTPSALTCDGGVSTSFDVIGDVTNPQSFNLQSLQAFTPSTTVQDYFVAGSSATLGEYNGALLWDLLKSAGIEVNPSVKNDLDRKYVVVTGTDCYQAVLAMSELDPSIAGSTQATIAYGQWVNGQDTSLAGNGFARLILPGDKKGARSVSNVAQIQVVSVPPPTP